MFGMATIVGLCLGGTPIPQLARDLDLRVTVVEALEGGPVVLDIALTNRGKQTVGYEESSVHGPVWRIQMPDS